MKTENKMKKTEFFNTKKEAIDAVRNIPTVIGYTPKRKNIKGAMPLYYCEYFDSATGN